MGGGEHTERMGSRSGTISVGVNVIEVVGAVWVGECEKGSANDPTEH
jgi:hypothetical protein